MVKQKEFEKAAESFAKKFGITGIIISGFRDLSTTEENHVMYANHIKLRHIVKTIEHLTEVAQQKVEERKDTLNTLMGSNKKKTVKSKKK